MVDRVTFPAAPLSVRSARRYVGDRTVALGYGDDLRSSAELLTSELATNALVHARTEFTVAVLATESGLRIEVEDGAASLERVATEAGPDAVTGRGLHLVDAIAANWGIEPTEAGKLIWFELAAG